LRGRGINGQRAGYAKGDERSQSAGEAGSSEEGLTGRRHRIRIESAIVVVRLFLIYSDSTCNVHARADLEIAFEIITDWAVVQFQRKIERGRICAGE
jgi:hypothetical protein